MNLPGALLRPAETGSSSAMMGLIPGFFPGEILRALKQRMLRSRNTRNTLEDPAMRGFSRCLD
jgi:hypothetical protein